MSLVAITQTMLDVHEKHTAVRERCPLCRRYGPAPAPEAAYKGRLIAVNPPTTADVAEW